MESGSRSRFPLSFVVEIEVLFIRSAIDPRDPVSGKPRESLLRGVEEKVGGESEIRPVANVFCGAIDRYRRDSRIKTLRRRRGE